MEDNTKTNQQFETAAVSQTSQDIINATLIVSVVINLAVFIVWILAR
jgi:hypothetical protein